MEDNNKKVLALDDKKKKDEIIQRVYDRFEVEKWGDGYNSIRVITTVDLYSGKITTSVDKR